MPRPPLRIGTRASDLAVAQTELAIKHLEHYHPNLKIEIVLVETSGDRDQKTPLGKPSKDGVKALDKSAFTKELEIALAENQIDVAVHSLKDVPTELDPAFALAGCLPRGKIEDVLVTRQPMLPGLKNIPEKWIIGTCSPRRRRQILEVAPHVKFKDLRGNIATRVEKLCKGGGYLHGIMLARCGLERIGYKPASGWIIHKNQRLYAHVQMPPRFLPAACQGAIGFEIRHDDFDTALLIESVCCDTSWARVRCERHFLAVLKAGCHTPVAIHTIANEEEGTLRAMAAVYPEKDESAPAFRGESEGSLDNPEDVATVLAENLS